MKKLFLLFSLVFIVFMSCSSDNKEQNTQQLPITAQNVKGKWFYQGSTINSGTFIPFQQPCASIKSYRDFLENGNVDVVSYDANCEITSSLTTFWNLNNNNLTLITENENQFIVSIVYQITYLTDTEMQLKQTVVNPDNTIVYLYYYSRF